MDHAANPVPESVERGCWSIVVRMALRGGVEYGPATSAALKGWLAPYKDASLVVGTGAGGRPVVEGVPTDEPWFAAFVEAVVGVVHMRNQGYEDRSREPLAEVARLLAIPSDQRHVVPSPPAAAAPATPPALPQSPDPAAPAPPNDPSVQGVVEPLRQSERLKVQAAAEAEKRSRRQSDGSSAGPSELEEGPDPKRPRKTPPPRGPKGVQDEDEEPDEVGVKHVYTLDTACSHPGGTPVSSNR